TRETVTINRASKAICLNGLSSVALARGAATTGGNLGRHPSRHSGNPASAVPNRAWRFGRCARGLPAEVYHTNGQAPEGQGGRKHSSPRDQSWMPAVSATVG